MSLPLSLRMSKFWGIVKGVISFMFMFNNPFDTKLNF
nr:MAG TPA: hypothetical protein [Microviridae sp.]